MGEEKSRNGMKRSTCKPICGITSMTILKSMCSVVDNSSTVTIQVYARHTLPVDDLVGEIEERMDMLVGAEKSRAYSKRC